MSNRVEIREKFSSALIALGQTTVTKTQIKEICSNLGISGAQWFTKDESNRVGRGLYRVPTIGVNAPQTSTIDMSANILPMTKKVETSDNRIKNIITDLDETNLIPNPYKNYVPFGNFDDVLAIVKSMRFFPAVSYTHLRAHETG
jgi:hypothetical protein